MDKLKNKAPQEILKDVTIQSIEKECLDRVFKYLIEQDKTKKGSTKNKIGPTDLMKCLNFLGLKPLKAEVAMIIWEVDEDLDGYVSHEEYMTMYKRCINDKSGLELRKLFNLVQFLMYDKTFRGRVTVEETLQIMYVRHGRDKLDEEITEIFGKDETNADGSEKVITFGEYIDKVNQRSLREFKESLKGYVFNPAD